MSENAKHLGKKSEIKESDSEIERISSKIDWMFSSPVKVMRVLGSLAIVAMMLLMTIDVLGRYFFKHPLLGTDEIVGILNVCLAAACFGYCQRMKRHISVDLLTGHFSLRVRTFLDILANSLAVAVALLIAWQLFLGAQAFFSKTAAGSPVSVALDIPWYPFILVLAIGFFVYGLTALADLIVSICKISRFNSQGD